jgi:hypothetical protein
MLWDMESPAASEKCRSRLGAPACSTTEAARFYRAPAIRAILLPGGQQFRNRAVVAVKVKQESV